MNATSVSAGDGVAQGTRRSRAVIGGPKEALVSAGYGINYDRLVELKAKYDPTNLFRMNLNITPAS